MFSPPSARVVDERRGQRDVDAERARTRCRREGRPRHGAENTVVTSGPRWFANVCVTAVEASGHVDNFTVPPTA
jgi:hypothetical protein